MLMWKRLNSNKKIYQFLPYLASLLMLSTAQTYGNQNYGAKSYGASIIDNEIIEIPQIQCTETGVTFQIRTKYPFRGNIYVRGQFGIPNCRREFYTNDANNAGFALRHEECGMTKIKQLQPYGINYQVIIVVSFHPQFTTKVDRSYNLKCFYAQVNADLQTQLQVGELPTANIESANIMMPNCKYSMRLETFEGPIAKTVALGDPIVHVWECSNPNYGMLVKNCYVTDGGETSAQILDERGCPTKTSVIQDQLIYNDLLTMAYVNVLAYGFPDRSIMNFQCQIQVCRKSQGECLGFTPPNCPQIGVSDYYPNSRINTNVDPTQVIGTYQEPTPYLQNPGLNQYSSSSSSQIPFNLRNGEYSQADSLFNIQRPFSHIRRTSEKTNNTERNFLKDNQNQTANHLLVLGRSPRISPNASKVFKPVSDTQTSKSNGRQRRADEKTMDVVASPVTIFSDEEDLDIEHGRTSKQVFRSHFSSSSKDSYCVNKLGLVVAILCMSLMLLFSITLAAYVFNDLLRKKNGKGIITKNQDDFCPEENKIRWFHNYFSSRNPPTNLNSGTSPTITTLKRESSLAGFTNSNKIYS